MKKMPWKIFMQILRCKIS